MSDTPNERNACGVRLPADSAERLGAGTNTTCARPAGHATHDDGNGVLWVSKRADQDERDADVRAVAAELVSTKEALNAAYRERAHLVALLAAVYPSLWTPGEDDPAWRIVYVELPTGQASWHVAPDDWGLFAHVPAGLAGAWDGHSTEAKYDRIDNLTRMLHTEGGIEAVGGHRDAR